MTFLRTLKADLKRAVTSPLLWSAVIIMALFTIVPLIGFLSRFVKTGDADALTVLNFSISGDGISAITWSLLPTLGVPLALASDYEDRADIYWATRCGSKNYLVSKLIASGISGFLAQFAMFTVISAFLFTMFPINGGYDSGGQLEMYAASVANPYWGYFLAIVYLSLSGFWAGFTAAAFSAFVPNRFAAMASPTIIYFFILYVTTTPNIPTKLSQELFRIERVSWSEYYCAQNIYEALGAKLFTVGLTCLVFGIAAVLYKKRRLEDA